jgi:4-hydroxybenzoyl-CoA reductase subunit beta
VVALGRIRELDGIAHDPCSGLRIGALARVADLAAHPAVRRLYPVLAEAAASVAGPTLREMGTAGGNLCVETRCHWYNQSFHWRRACGFCLKKDGTVCHVAPGSEICLAAYSGDLAPALLALHAEVAVRSADGERRVPLALFYRDDGARTFDLAPDEIITEIRVPASRAGLAGVYRKLRSRGSIDFPLAGVAVAARIDGGTLREASIALTAVAPRPFAVPGASDALEGRDLGDDDALKDAVRLARRSAVPLRTTGALPPAYRKHRVGLFVRDALRALGGVR